MKSLTLFLLSLCVAVFSSSYSQSSPWSVSNIGGPAGGMRTPVTISSKKPSSISYTQNYTQFGPVSASVLLGNDALVFGTVRGEVVCLNPSNGNIVWNFSLPHYPTCKFECKVAVTGLVVSANDRIFVSGADWSIFTINVASPALELYTTVVPKRRDQTNGGLGIVNPVALPSTNGVVYQTGDGAVNSCLMGVCQSLKINHDDEVNQLEGTPLVDVLSDNYFVPSTNGSVYCFAWPSKLMWKFSTGSTVRGMTLSPDATYLIIASYDTHVYKVDAVTGKQIWKSPDLGVGSIFTNPVISPDQSLIYIAAGSNPPVLVNASDGTVIGDLNCSNPALFTTFSGEPTVDPHGSLLYFINARTFGCSDKHFPASLIYAKQSTSFPMPTWTWNPPAAWLPDHMEFLQPLVRTDGAIYLLANYLPGAWPNFPSSLFLAMLK